MIYVIGSGSDMNKVMEDRPLVDLARVVLVKTEADLQGRILTSADEIYWGANGPTGWARADIQKAIDIARERGQMEEVR